MVKKGENNMTIFGIKYSESFSLQRQILDVLTDLEAAVHVVKDNTSSSMELDSAQRNDLYKVSMGQLKLLPLTEEEFKKAERSICLLLDIKVS